MSAESAYTYQRRHRDAGLCRYCSLPVFAGTLLCEIHLKRERDKSRARIGWKGDRRGRRPAEESNRAAPLVTPPASGVS